MGDEDVELLKEAWKDHPGYDSATSRMARTLDERGLPTAELHEGNYYIRGKWEPIKPEEFVPE